MSNIGNAYQGQISCYGQANDRNVAERVNTADKSYGRHPLRRRRLRDQGKQVEIYWSTHTFGAMTPAIAMSAEEVRPDPPHAQRSSQRRMILVATQTSSQTSSQSPRNAEAR
jgi:hypothetical protein